MISPYSPYMEFAKTRQAGRYTLATSGIRNCPLSLLPVTLEELSLDRPGGYGYGPLQEALARHCSVTPDCVVAAGGTSMANYLAIGAMVEPGDEVLVESPTYELILAVLRYLRLNVKQFQRRPEDGYRIDVEEVRRLVTPKTKLIILTNLHNPSSALVDEATLRALGELGPHVLVDEVYLPALFEATPLSAFHLGPQFIVTTSLTKVYGLSGIRCGWILAAPDLAWRMWRLNDLFGVVPPHPTEQMGVIALANLGPLAQRARNILDANRPVLNAFLSSRRDLDSTPSEFGTISFPRIKAGRVNEFCDMLRSKYETTVVQGEYFDCPDHIRIGIGGDPEMTAEGLKRLALALDEWGH
ncbi:MAG: aminotransferase class I/II-fold pyridoxal phosphate-dependent enzyme [Bryobacteraceae bacterium]